MSLSTFTFDMENLTSLHMNDFSLLKNWDSYKFHTRLLLKKKTSFLLYRRANKTSSEFNPTGLAKVAIYIKDANGVCVSA